MAAGIIYILFGVIGKFSAIFITIPYPVLGGAMILMYGTYFGVILSNLQVRIELINDRNWKIFSSINHYTMFCARWRHDFAVRNIFWSNTSNLKVNIKLIDDKTEEMECNHSDDSARPGC